MTDTHSTPTSPQSPQSGGGQTKEEKIAALQEQINKLIDEREKLKG